MEIDKNKFALAAALVLSAWSLICAVIVSITPDLAVKLFGWMVHLVNLQPANITFAEFIGGLVQVFIYTYITAWVFAYLHNRFLKPRA